MTRRVALLALASALIMPVAPQAYADTCFTKGQQLAASRGATLVGAEAATQEGKAVCKVILLVPDASGGRPKREVVFVDQ